MKILISIILAFPLLAQQAQESSTAAELSKACRDGDAGTVESLLSAGLDPNRLEHYGKTPLYYAVSFNRVEIVDLLLEHHADPNTPSLPLQAAAETGNLRTSRMLIDAGARVNTRTATGQTALHSAVEGDHLDVIRFLIDSGADIGARDKDGISPLDDAVWRGHLDAAALLIAHGARAGDVEPQTGATPLNEAAYRGNSQLVRYLLQFDPDLERPDRKGFKPLENAVRMGKTDAALVLLDAEAKNRTSVPSFNKTLAIAIGKDDSAIVESLLHHGIEPNAETDAGATLLDSAAIASAAKTTGVLLTNGADPDKAGRNGARPLQDAALKGATAIVQTLLDHGVQPDSRNSATGVTALYNAAAFGRADVVKLLLARGADPDLCGAEQVTPAVIAAENGFHAIASEIRSRGGSRTCKPPQR